MDTLASEYGWTKTYILERVYPLEALLLLPKIAQRQLHHFVDQLEVQIMTKHELKPDERTKWLAQVDRMRSMVQDQPPPDKPFDREKFEQLREIMNGRKGKGPQRVK